MSQDFIQLPELSEIKEDLVLARQDISSAVQEDDSLEPIGKFVEEVITIIENKASSLSAGKPLDTKTKVDIAAHLTLLNSLMDEIFLSNLEDEFTEEEEEVESEDDR
ncbi:hypothetical protein [Candidatus Protochlamydia sp. R18]|uniref:hypothetical protein n=1 Tax=Candidatus Protochlamydia sp. R18 TaxID=1353977 RepID=UPI0005AAA19A|nr:hypothetical protein [Candidatus Protochlamydia sp. R18]